MSARAGCRVPSPLLLLQKGPPSNPGGGARGWALTCPQVTRGHVCRTEIFSGKSVAHEDIQYEQACILYNLGELPPARPHRRRALGHAEKTLLCLPISTSPLSGRQGATCWQGLCGAAAAGLRRRDGRDGLCRTA